MQYKIFRFIKLNKSLLCLVPRYLQITNNYVTVKNYHFVQHSYHNHQYNNLIVNNSSSLKSFRYYSDKGVNFDQICSETLDSLCEFFENLIENVPHLENADVNFGDGVLTVNFGERYGTYVINRQTPNQQIWLSSPKSGPKRYDLICEQDRTYWLYRHDDVTLHKFLENELSEICQTKIDLSKCQYYFTRLK